MNLLQPFIWFLPAYVANASATLARFLPETHPVDRGLEWGGRRLLGNGKTWEGLIIGTCAGVLVGVFIHSLPDALLMSLGAMVGDMVGSFVKRRAGLRRGEEAPLLDQLDFVIGSFLLVPPPPRWAVLIVVATPFIHRTASVLGHLLGVKREPW